MLSEERVKLEGHEALFKDDKEKNLELEKKIIMKTDDSFLATYYGIKWTTSSGYVSA